MNFILPDMSGIPADMSGNFPDRSAIIEDTSGNLADRSAIIEDMILILPDTTGNMADTSAIIPDRSSLMYFICFIFYLFFSNSIHQR